MQIIPAAWIESLKAGNSNAKLETLKLAVRTYKDLMEILQIVGTVEKITPKLVSVFRKAS